MSRRRSTRRRTTVRQGPNWGLWLLVIMFVLIAIDSTKGGR